jgi:hypothetical protein
VLIRSARTARKRRLLKLIRPAPNIAIWVLRKSAAEPRSRKSVSLLGILQKERDMNGLIYLIGLIVVIMAILSFFGLR